MTPAELEQFTRQLQAWAQDIIDHGRMPFRRVEAFSSVWTSSGEVSVPLVLWVNRGSLQAGGVIFFSQTQQPLTDVDRAAAHGLGLSHYVEWGPQQICFWQRITDGPDALVDEIKVDANSLPDFHQLLTSVLERLKVFAVTGAVAPDALSAEYLVNLCRHVVRTKRQSLIEASRIHLDQHPEMSLWTNAEQLAAHMAAVSMLRLMSLNLVDILPLGITPERLERAIALAQSQLPPGLALPESAPFPLPALPHDFSVKLHGFYRRLEQIGLRQNHPRLADAIKQFWPWLLAELKTTADPPQSKEICTVEPGHALTTNTAIEVSQWPTLLIARALWRFLHQIPPVDQLWTKPLGWPKPNRSLQIALHEGLSVPTRQQHGPLLSQLKPLWPGRRLKLSVGTPTAVFQFLDLLGRLQGEQLLWLTLPEDWLRQSWWQPIHQLVKDGFHLCHLARGGEQKLELGFRRSNQSEAFTEITCTDGPASLPWTLLKNAPSSTWLLLPRVNTAVIDLVHNERLVFLQDETAAELLQPFAQTTMARQQWCCLRTAVDGDDNILPMMKSGMIIPSEDGMARLRSDPEALHDPDLALANGLGLEALPQFVAVAEPTKPPSAKQQTLNRSALEKQLLKCLDTEGAPSFPEQYLYHVDNNQLTTYRLTAPLTVSDSFFGRTQVSDVTGQSVQVSEDHAMALQLAIAQNPPEITLPSDPEETRKIMQRYQRDLNLLYAKLKNLAVAGSQQPRQAKRLVDRFWQERGLPKIDN